MPNPVEDELAIRELVALYADAVNRVDEAQWADTWTENAQWSLPMVTVDGKSQIVGLWVQAMSSFEFVAQLVYQGVVKISGNEATGRWYLCEHLRSKGDSTGRFNIGTYNDVYVKEGDRWRFASRQYHVLYNDEGAGDMSGTVIPLPTDR
jgi:ketosteroid isomerase-like protein